MLRTERETDSRLLNRMCTELSTLLHLHFCWDSLLIQITVCCHGNANIELFVAMTTCCLHDNASSLNNWTTKSCSSSDQFYVNALHLGVSLKWCKWSSLQCFYACFFFEERTGSLIKLTLKTTWSLYMGTGVAEPGGPGGPWPPQKFEWVGQGMFRPPQNFDHWPPQNRQPVVKLFAKLLLSTLKCAKFTKFSPAAG